MWPYCIQTMRVVLLLMVSVTQLQFALLCPESCIICSTDAIICSELSMIIEVPDSTKALMLTDGRIETVDRIMYSDLSNMSILVLSNNIISTITENAFQNLTILRMLSLDHNLISSSSLDKSTFSWLHNLETLHLGHNSLMELNGAWFQKTISLKTLLLEGNLFTSLNSSIFASSDLKNLETLDLSDNLIDYVGRDSFRNLPRLRSLDLSRNRLKNMPDAFSYLSQLSMLKLDLNRWNCSCELRELAHFLNSYNKSPNKVLYNTKKLVCANSDNPKVQTVLELTKVNCMSTNRTITVDVIAKSSITSQRYIRDVVIAVVFSCLGTSESMVMFPTDGDMLEFLLKNGEIQEKDGLEATWYHSANSKAEIQKALESDVMILEADVNVHGHNTVNETNLPIMAHPPDIYSDNTLKEWLDAVINSMKGIKLDFKSLQAVEPSLNLLRIKNQTGINRPVWLNADILPGPNVPGFWPVINGTRFFELIQMKFPDVTISPGWKVLYLPSFPHVTYTQAMVMKMYNTVKHLSQRITFPVLAVMAKNGWPHLSWLLSQSARFSLTLWQGQENPTVNDLLFIRDNSNPRRIYYDIYEPVLSQFKEAAKQKDRPRRFYTGGDIMEYFKPANSDGLNILWEVVYDRASLLSILKESPGGMLVIPVTSGTDDVRTPVVQGSLEELHLQNCLDLILASKNPWGIYLKVKSKTQLATSLHLLQEAYANDLLYHPVWINMDISHGVFNVKGYTTGLEFVSSIKQIFPYVIMAPSWPPEILDQGYTPQMVEDMLELFQEVWQDVSLQLLAVHLERSEAGIRILQQTQARFSLTVEHRTSNGGLEMESFALVRNGTRQRTFYNIPKAMKSFISKIPKNINTST